MTSLIRIKGSKSMTNISYRLTSCQIGVEPPSVHVLGSIANGGICSRQSEKSCRPTITTLTDTYVPELTVVFKWHTVKVSHTAANVVMVQNTYTILSAHIFGNDHSMSNHFQSQSVLHCCMQVVSYTYQPTKIMKQRSICRNKSDMVTLA